MRKFQKVLVGTACALLWGFCAVEFLVPGGVDALIGGLQRNIEVEIADNLIPLTTPQTDGHVNNGWLQVKNGQLHNAAGEPFQLRGMSSHGLAWFPEYTGINAIATTKSYGANLFRIAMYVDDDKGNYTIDLYDKESNTAAMVTAIDNALRLDMYVIADWHILKDGNPLSRVECAVEFFDMLSAKYADEPGVVYEICNEPNGETTWEDICAYADQVIPVIRANAPNALVLVGTPDFSSNLMAAISTPLPYDNIMYSYHYYTNTPDKSYSAVLEYARDAQTPVFVSEWGIGDGVPSPTEQETQRAAEFLAYLQTHSISWANWSLCNKDESYSAILPGVDSLGGWTEADLTESGKLVFKALRQ